MVTVTLGSWELSVLAGLITLFILAGLANAVVLWMFLKSWRKAFEHSDVV